MVDRSGFFTRKEIEKSASRIQRVFDGKYGPHPIYDGNNPIGSVTVIANQIIVSFRGSLGAEALPCGLMCKTSLKHVGIKGKAHTGIYKIFMSIRENVLTTINKLINAHKLDKEKINLIVEGHSRGASIAILMAAYLKNRFQNCPLFIMTYSTMAILDKEGAANFTQAIGQENHLAFAADKDFFINLSGKFNFQPVGIAMPFAPDLSAFFRQHVAQRDYPHLTNNWFIAGIVKALLFPRACQKWNAHMLETYSDVAPTLV